MSWLREMWEEIRVYLIVVVGVLAFFAVMKWITPDITKTQPIDDSRDTAILYIQHGLKLVKFDNQNVERKSRFFAEAAEVIVPAGVHVLVFDHKHSTSGFGTTTKYEANGITLKIPFENGKYYYVNWKVMPGDQISTYWNETKEGEYLNKENKRR